MTISISITVSKYSKNYSGTYSSPTESITIVEETELDQWVNELKESNNEETNPSFNKDIDFVVDDGNEGEPAGIFIQNSASPNHSIATGDSGQIDVVMNVPLPPNKSFYLYITIDSAFFQLTASSDISITIKKENNQNVTFNKSVSINNSASWGGLITGKSINTYVYLDGGNNLTSSDTAPSNSNYCISYVEGDIITISFSGTENAAIGNQSIYPIIFQKAGIPSAFKQE